MTSQEQLLAFLDANGIPYERNPGGSGETIKVPDYQAGATGYAHWRFDYAGALEYVTHHAE